MCAPGNGGVTLHAIPGHLCEQKEQREDGQAAIQDVYVEPFED
jgi:hypothetical protein